MTTNVVWEYSLVSSLAKKLENGAGDEGILKIKGLVVELEPFIETMIVCLYLFFTSLNHRYSLILCSLFSVCSKRNTVRLNM